MAGSITMVRGSTVFFNAQCTNAAGQPVAPTSAKLYLTFTKANQQTGKVVIDMTVVDVNLSAQWESAGVGPCQVFWSIRAIGANTIAADGSFAVAANAANPSPAG